jgi:uncharacterized membrane protein HdeD (DUF308 family)
MATHAEGHPGWDRRRLVYGDWTWLVRDGLDVLRLVFLAGTVVFAIQGRSEAVALTAASSVLLIARVVDLPRWFDFGLIVAITLIAWGTALGLYGDWDHYDKVVHGLSPIGYAPVLYIALVRLGVVPDPERAIREQRVARISGIFIVTLAVGIAVGAVYESIEWMEDKFGILGGHFVKGLWDTETDLLCDISGSFVGAVFLTVWALRGWSSHRVTVVEVEGPSETAVDAAAARLRADPPSVVSAVENRIAGVSPAAEGVVALVAGTLLLTIPGLTLRTVEIVFGVALLAYAAFELVELVRNRDLGERARSAASIAAAAAAGTLVLAWPSSSRLVLLYVAGVVGVVLAFVEAASLATATRSSRELWSSVAISVASLVTGLTLLAAPVRSLDAVTTLLGAFLLVLGVLRLVRAFEARRSSRA